MKMNILVTKNTDTLTFYFVHTDVLLIALKWNKMFLLLFFCLFYIWDFYVHFLFSTVSNFHTKMNILSTGVQNYSYTCLYYTILTYVLNSYIV